MLKRMGPLDKILGMLPGMGGMKELAGQKPDEKQLRRIEAIINSMTPEERKYADILDGSRRKRVAKGSGTTVEDVNRLLKQFVEMQRMLKMVGQMTGEPIAAAPKKKKKSPFSLMRVVVREARPRAPQESQMLSIRMRRTGSKKRPFFRVVVSEARSPEGRQFIEVLGFYNPRTKPAVVEINKERIEHWITNGARPSDSVRTLLASHLTRDRGLVVERR